MKEPDEETIVFGDLSSEGAEELLKDLGIASDSERLRELEELLIRLKLDRRPPELVN